MALIRPKRNTSYTLKEIMQDLYLRDSPALGFTYNDIPGCIQDAHMSVEEMLSNELLANSKWNYIRETHEWIPVFEFNTTCGQPSIFELVDMELDKSDLQWYQKNTWWATPKGFPRPQYEDEK